MTLHIPEACLKGLDKLVENGLYPNRSEVIRTAIRDLLRRELWTSNTRDLVTPRHATVADEF